MTVLSQLVTLPVPLNDFNVVITGNIEVVVFLAILSEPFIPFFRLPVLHNFDFRQSFLTIFLAIRSCLLVCLFSLNLLFGLLYYPVVNILSHGLLVHVIVFVTRLMFILTGWIG
jgi:hypothetical protein